MHRKTNARLLRVHRCCASDMVFSSWRNLSVATPRGGRDNHRCELATGDDRLRTTETGMALTGDRVVWGSFAGHTIELVRNNWIRTLTLVIGGRTVARAWRRLLRTTTLRGTIEQDGMRYAVIATSIPRFPSAEAIITVDGQALSLATQP